MQSTNARTDKLLVSCIHDAISIPSIVTRAARPTMHAVEGLLLFSLAAAVGEKGVEQALTSVSCASRYLKALVDTKETLGAMCWCDVLMC